MRIALLTLEALAAARAVRRFVASDPARIAMVAISDPFRPERGSQTSQTIERLRVSGPGILPYLALNFAAPRGARFLPRKGGTEAEATPLPELCARFGIPCDEVRNVNTEAFVARLKDSGADLIVTFHFDQILKEPVINALPLGGINVHAGLLPRHRGPVPTIHALIDDPIELGVSVHRLAPKIDAGELFGQLRIPDEPGLSALGAAARLHEAALPLLDRVIGEIEAGTARGTTLPVLPYRGWPTPADMKTLRLKGRSAANLDDLKNALGTPV